MNIIIVGAGASGLLASILLAKKGYKITLLEKEKKLAKKLRATGNGKCNITNLDISIGYYHSNDKLENNFILTYKEVKKVFLDLGIPFFENVDGRVFPMSKEANSVADKLIYLAQNLGVEIINECEVIDIKKGFIVMTSKGEFKSTKLIIATGSKAGRIGSDNLLEVLSNLGHTIYPLYPSLVQLITKEDFTKCSGVKVKANLSLYSNKEFIKEVYGDLLFTNYGISGLSVLDISVDIAKRLKNYEYLEIKVDFFPDINIKNILNEINNNIHIGMILRGILPAKLIPFVLKQANITSKQGLTKKEINKLSYVLKNYTIEIIDTKDIKNAEVVSGGVSIKEIDFNTMQSKKVKNLYLLGEILDIDGDRGGYNLHFAWSSAIKLANNM